MKTIIALTDFSSGSASASHYAAEVAKVAGARMVLMHVNVLPTVGIETPPVFMQLNYTDEEGQEAVRKEAEALKKMHGTALEIESVNRTAYNITESVKEYLCQHPADMLVAGMTGSGFLKEKLIGSTATSLIRHCGIPVMVIHEGTKFITPRNILFAYDAIRQPEKSKYNFLEEFAKLFGAKLAILNIFDSEKQALKVAQASSSGIVEGALKETRHSYHFVESTNVANTISKYAESKEADMIVTMPGKHGFFDTLIHEGNTKRLTFHTTLPLLAIQ